MCLYREEIAEYLCDRFDRLDAVYQHNIYVQTQVLKTMEAEYAAFLREREDAGI